MKRLLFKGKSGARSKFAVNRNLIYSTRMNDGEYRLMSEVSTEVFLQMFPLSFFHKICTLSDKSRLTERLKKIL